MNSRLEANLKILNVYEEETIHGAHAGTAITMSMLDISKSDIQAHIIFG